MRQSQLTRGHLNTECDYQFNNDIILKQPSPVILDRIPQSRFRKKSSLTGQLNIAKSMNVNFKNFREKLSKRSEETKSYDRFQ